MLGKRKRTYSGTYRAIPVAKRTRTTTTTASVPPLRPAQRGFYRRSGFYGRYQYGSKASEQKFFDTFLDGSYDATGEVLENGGAARGLVLIPQGVTESTRVGRKCVIKKIIIRGYMSKLTTASNDVIRMALVLDKQANGAYPAWTDVYTNATQEVTEHLNLANSQRFIILKDWFLTINSSYANDAVTAFSSEVRTFKKVLKCNLPLEFSSTTGAITELKSNNLVLIGSSLQDGVTTYKINIRVRFEDG